MEENTKLLSNMSNGSCEESLEGTPSSKDTDQKSCFNSRLSCLTSDLLNRLSSCGWKEELKEQLKIALPTALAQMSQLLALVISISFCGHVSEILLDSASLASIVINGSATSVLLGLSSACETLFSQTFGSENKKNVGMVLQRSLLILWMCCLPCSAIIVNTEHLLKSIGQNHEVARLSGKYAMIYICSLPALSLGNVLSRYLQTQSIVIPSLIIGLISIIVNTGLHFLLLLYLDLGISGAAIAVSITHWLTALLHFAYIVCSKIYIATWPGWSRECLYDWWTYVSLALPSVLMVCFEWWSFEIIFFVVGILGITPLAAISTLLNFGFFLFSMSYGLSVAGSVRIGNYLGAGSPQKARKASQVALGNAVTWGILAFSSILIFRHTIPLAFTNDSDVISLVTDMIPTSACHELFDMFQSSFNGVIRGVGHQTYAAVANLVCFYVVMLPISVSLALKTSLGIQGALIGMIVGGCVLSLIYAYKFWVVDWDKESEKAQVRAGVKKSIPLESKPLSIENRNIEHAPCEESDTLYSANYLAKSGICSIKKSYDDDNNNTKTTGYNHSLLKIILFRIATLLLFTLPVILGVTIKVYLDAST